MGYYVYVLKSETTGRLYIGCTQDVDDRLKRHQAGREKATRKRGPWHLVHVEEHATLALARKREHYLKHKPGAAREKKRWRETDIAGP